MMSTEIQLLERLARRAGVLATKMIDDANHRDDVEEGDPKVGGHPASCASCAQILSTLHFKVAGPFDTFAVKPHASPVDHAINFLLGAFREPFSRRWLSLQESQAVMSRLRRFSFEGEPVFQSYHAESDPDSWGYFPSGSVGIPPVVSMYTALAYRYAKHHGHEVPEGAHHWSLIGDSEFREGSLLEAMPEAAERELANVTWIIDFNRQNLDGPRMPGENGLHGSDAARMEGLARANGWECQQVVHGRKRLAVFAETGGDRLRELLEHGLGDNEFQSVLYKRSGAATRAHLVRNDPGVEAFLAKFDDAGVQAIFEDLGGHDVAELAAALEKARAATAPTLIIAHTIKGFGLSSFAAPGNHSAQPPRDEVAHLLSREGLTPEAPYQRFAEGSAEARFLEARGAQRRTGVEAQWAICDRNASRARAELAKSGELPDSFQIDLRMTPVAHTQYVWGQAIGKIIRIGTANHVERSTLSDAERPWGAAADCVMTMAPDVGTSTNINPAMDDKIYGPAPEEDYEKSLGTRDRRRPGLTPTEEVTTRHIRFEITEANCMSAVGAFGKLQYSLGIPYLPVMTVYDFFIKRAYDQLYYNLYWKSNFLLVGTPSGVTLSPEGAQHSWKSDIQMPNLVAWEPMFGVEVDWIVAETLKRHVRGDTENRSGVLLRCVTRGLPQKELMTRLRRHAANKVAHEGPLRPAGITVAEGVDESTVAALPDAGILSRLRPDVLAGGYYLVDWRGYAGYEPGDNVVNLFAMGAIGTNALQASDLLLEKGIYANVILVTSPDLLAGNQGYADHYRHLREGLGLDGALHVVAASGVTLDSRAALVEAAAGRVPVVSAVDGEPGILDNLGSIIGVPQVALGLRKASKCGRPSDVYALHHLDAHSLVDAALEALARSQVGGVRVSPSLAGQSVRALDDDASWQAAWGREAGAPTLH